MKLVFDTNILIDYLKGIGAAKEIIENYRDKLISIITWMEVLVGTKPEHQQVTKSFLRQFTVVEVNSSIAQIAVFIRQEYKIKLPDALILATAEQYNALLVTRNTKDFSEDNPAVLVPYRL